MFGRSGEVVTLQSAKLLLQGFDSPLRLQKTMLWFFGNNCPGAETGRQPRLKIE